MSDSMHRLIEIMARLRDPDSGCPWDLKQTFESIAPYTIEEAYEVADAIENGSPENLADELGDLLFQVLFHSQMAMERGWFDFQQVALGLAIKMERRHPHVFGDDPSITTAQDQSVNWEAIKAAERGSDGDQSALAGIARGLPEWQRALKLQKRAARVGFDWTQTPPVIHKIREELAEVEQALAEGNVDSMTDETGDLLFSVINLARHLNIDPGRALRLTNTKFERRFREMERLAEGSVEGLALDDQEALWRQAKDRD